QAGVPIYQSTGRIVRAIRFNNPKGAKLDDKGRAPDAYGVMTPLDALQMQDVESDRLREYLIKNIRFKQWKKDNLVEIAAPMLLVKHYMARAGEWQLPVLRGIRETP